MTEEPKTVIQHIFENRYTQDGNLFIMVVVILQSAMFVINDTLTTKMPPEHLYFPIAAFSTVVLFGAFMKAYT